VEDRVFSSKKPQKPQKVPKNDPQKVPKNTLKTAIFASLGRGEKNGPVMTLKTP